MATPGKCGPEKCGPETGAPETGSPETGSAEKGDRKTYCSKKHANRINTQLYTPTGVIHRQYAT
jgi:hypothetical protein